VRLGHRRVQPLPRRDTRPRGRVDFAHQIEQLFGFFLRIEIAMCRRKRSRPSSRRRDMKNLKRLSSGSVGGVSPIGLVEALRLMTNCVAFVPRGKLLPALGTCSPTAEVADCIRYSPIPQTDPISAVWRFEVTRAAGCAAQSWQPRYP